MDIDHNRMTLSIPSNPRYLGTIRAFFRSLLQEIQFDNREVSSIVLAIHEACTNVIEHCYGGDPTQRIDFAVLIAPEHVHIDIRDYGEKQDVSKFKPRALQDVRPRGLGTHFMQSVMDEVTYNSSDAGTLVRMTKRRSVSCKSP